MISVQSLRWNGLLLTIWSSRTLLASMKSVTMAGYWPFYKQSPVMKETTFVKAKEKRSPGLKGSSWMSHVSFQNISLRIFLSGNQSFVVENGMSECYAHFGKSSSVNLTLTWVWISPSPYVYSCPDSSGRQSDEGYNRACRKRSRVSLWCLLPPRWVTPKSTKVEEKWSRSGDI